LTLTVRSEGQSREVELLSTDRTTTLKRPSGI